VGDWNRYTSPSTFPHIKAAKQEASKLAMETFLAKTRDERPLMYKNRLQEFTKRSGFAILVYQTVNDRQTLDPKFRATVWVAEISYTSQSTFPKKELLNMKHLDLLQKLALGRP